MVGKTKLEVKYYNIKQLILGTIFLVLGGVISYFMILEHSLTSFETLIGLFFAVVGIIVIVLWNKIECYFDKNSNLFEYKSFSFIRGSEDMTHKLDKIEKVIYSERMRRSGKGRTKLRRVAMVEMENGITYPFHKSSGRMMNVFRNRTMKKAQEVAEFLDVELDKQGFSPGQAINKITDMIGGGS